MNDFGARLPVLLPRAIAWAKQQSQEILESGVALNEHGLAVARAVGVKHAERIRLWTVIDIPAPADIELRQLAFEKNLVGPGTRGLTLGYGIFIRQGELDVELLAHECRHVYQVEQAGSLDAFLAIYLQQVADFEYRDAPYEVDARAHAHAFATARERGSNVGP